MLWNWQTGERLTSLQGHHQGIESLAVSHDSHLFISSGEDLEVNLWNWDLAQLLTAACDQVNDYLAHNPTIFEERSL